jgi:hypothetical protein
MISAFRSRVRVARRAIALACLADFDPPHATNQIHLFNQLHVTRGITVPEKAMTSVLVPEISELGCTSVYDHRVLFLSGTWERPGNGFRLRATIIVGDDGSLDGAIYWQAVRVHGQAAHYFATEWVRGFIKGRDVELEGYEVEPGLSPDSYRITLCGDGDAGPFGGITRTWLNSWEGRINGHYQFRNRRA